MAAASDLIKNINLFVDGRGYAGRVMELTPPPLTLLTEEYRAGGMDVPIQVEMGQEVMEASFVLSAYDSDVLALWGVVQGNGVDFTFRAVMDDLEGVETAVVINMRGLITGIDRGAWAPSAIPQATFTVNPRYYKETHGQRVIHEIDAVNLIRVVDGVDRLAGQRAALQIPG